MGVEEEFIEKAASGAANFGAGAMDVLLYVILALVVLGLAFFIWYMLSFKHQVIVRYLTRSGSFIIRDRAKVVKEDGVLYWKFLKGKMVATPPPKAAINVTKKGRLFAECYITEDNPEPVWMIDRGIDKTNTEKSSFRPVTTQQRALIVSRIRKAESRRGSTLWDKIQAIVMPVSVVLVLLLLFVFWGDITKTSTDALKEAQGMFEQNAQIAESNARILAVLAGKLDAGEIQIAQSPPDANLGGED